MDFFFLAVPFRTPLLTESQPGFTHAMQRPEFMVCDGEKESHYAALQLHFVLLDRLFGALR